MISQIEEAARCMRTTGLRDKWLAEADEHTRAVAGGVNAPLFERLLHASGYVDVECVRLFRSGLGFRISGAVPLP